MLTAKEKRLEVKIKFPCNIFQKDCYIDEVPKAQAESQEWGRSFLYGRGGVAEKIY